MKFEASSSDRRSFSDMKSNNSPPRNLKKKTPNSKFSENWAPLLLPTSHILGTRT